MRFRAAIRCKKDRVEARILVSREVWDVRGVLEMAQFEWMKFAEILLAGGVEIVQEATPDQVATADRIGE